MSEIVVDTDFVRQIVQGSANIDRMQDEIRLVMSLIIGNVRPAREFEIPFDCVRSDPALPKTWWQVKVQHESVEGDIDGPGWRGNFPYITYHTLKGSDERKRTVVKQWSHQVDAYDSVPLKFVRAVHADLHVLLRGVLRECADPKFEGILAHLTEAA